MERSLTEIHNIIFSGELSKSDIVTIMVNLRVFLEDNSQKDDYPIIKLYSNWIVHSKISASYDAFKILELLTDSLLLYDNGSDSDKWINDAIIEGLSLHILQLELLEFNKKHPCGLNVFGDFKNWKVFASSLIYNLIDKPIKFPEKITNKKYKKIYEDIMLKAMVNGDLTYAVVFFKFRWDENIDNVVWEIKTVRTIEKKVTLLGHFSIITQEMVDNYGNNNANGKRQ